MFKSKPAGIAIVFGIMLFFVTTAFPALSNQPDSSKAKDLKMLRVIFPATLCATELPDELIAMFEKEYNIPIKKINLCTGDGDKLMRSDSAEPIDVFIGHEPDIENKLVADGYLVNLRQVLYSNFVLVGPKEDPAGIKGIKSPMEALKIIK